GLGPGSEKRISSCAATLCDWAVDVGAGHGELCLYLLNLHLNGEDTNGRLRVLNKLVGTCPRAEYVTLDSLELDRRKGGFIKIDVDGPECDVLDSGTSLLTEAKVCLLVETHSYSLEQDCTERLVSLGYSCTIIRNAGGG